MFKPIRWKTFVRDLFVIEIGLAMYGLAVAMMIRANLGTSAWAVLEVALSKILRVTPGTMGVLVGISVLSGVLILRERIGWGTLANIMSVGPWEDLALWLIPSIQDNLPLQIAMLVAAIALIGLASAIYIGVDAGAGPRDSLMLAIKRTTGVSLRTARGAIEVTVVAVGWLLGGPAGVGTLIFALSVGAAVQLGFKLLKVNPHRAPAEQEQVEDM